jgi:hypothetical protein
MLAALQRTAIGFLNILQAAHLSDLPKRILDRLALPTQRGRVI